MNSTNVARVDGPFAVVDNRAKPFFSLENDLMERYMPALGAEAFAMYCYIRYRSTDEPEARVCRVPASEMHYAFDAMPDHRVRMALEILTTLGLVDVLPEDGGFVVWAPMKENQLATEDVRDIAYWIQGKYRLAFGDVCIEDADLTIGMGQEEYDLFTNGEPIEEHSWGRYHPDRAITFK